MDMFRTPGANLIGLEKIAFDEIKTAVERCANDFLLRPDWDANMNCVDLVINSRNQNVLAEMVFIFRKKINNKNPKVVFHTLVLIEALVKNCGAPMHQAVNAESFMKEMGKCARKYVGKVGADSKEVADQCLDMIQAWGEGFLPHQQTFPNIIRLYQELRRERMPFKTQYDAARVPLFTPSNPIPPPTAAAAAAAPSIPRAGAPPLNNDQTAEDELLAATLAASLQDFGIISKGGARNSDSEFDNNSQNRSRTRTRSVEPSSRLSKEDAIDSLTMSLTLLCEILSASQSSAELSKNDIAIEIVNQIAALQSNFGALIEQELIAESEGIDLLFKLNDDSQSMLGIYNDCITGKLNIFQAKEKASMIDLTTTAPSAHAASSSAPSSSSSARNTAKAPTTSASLLDLDIFDVKPYIHDKPPRPSNNNYNNNNVNTNTQKPITTTTSFLDHPTSSTQGPSITVSKLPLLPPRPSTSHPNVSDPFGDSASTIDMLLLTEPAPAPRRPSASATNNSNDPFGDSTSKASSIDYLLLGKQPSTSTSSSSNPPPLPPKAPYSADPLDGLMSIATRADDDFGIIGTGPSSAPPAVPVSTSTPTKAAIKPLAPPRQSIAGSLGALPVHAPPIKPSQPNSNNGNDLLDLF